MAQGSVGSVLASLSKQRNRYILYSLARHAENAPMGVEMLAREVAGLEHGIDPESVPDETFETVLDDLSRNSLPTLSYRGLVEYDPLSGLVGRPKYSSSADTLVSLLARIELSSVL